MIKINLLPQRKKVTRQSKGEQTLLIGLVILAALAAMIYFVVHRPKAQELEDQEQTNSQIERENKRIADEIKDLAKKRAAIKAARAQRDAIARLNAARATPAWMLFELSQILTRGGNPLVTAQMAEVLKNNPNRNWQPTWDPKHIWITKIVEKKGVFSLEGGAQSDSDITQLALRLQASMFFDNVKPSKSGIASDKNSGISFYRFTITGKVRY